MAATALTMGEPAGVGSEITLKAWLLRQDEALDPFFVIADPREIVATVDRLGLTMKTCEIVTPGEAGYAFADGLPVLPVELPSSPTPGIPQVENAPAVLAAIEKAVEFASRGLANAVVTNPINKGVLAAAGFAYGGHTDYLMALTNAPAAEMMLVSPRLKVVPATIHVGLREAIANLSTARLVSCITTTVRSLVSDFAIASPRVAVSGLNPHAGEEGLFGFEERLIIDPALDELRDAGIDVNGPKPADSLFHEKAREGYDVAVCMYHDQALIPLKTLDFDRAVNTTLGLPIVRTSPDHGTAFDIAGRGEADPSSLIAAIKLAQNVARRRAGVL